MDCHMGRDQMVSLGLWSPQARSLPSICFNCFTYVACDYKELWSLISSALERGLNFVNIPPTKRVKPQDHLVVSDRADFDTQVRFGIKGI